MDRKDSNPFAQFEDHISTAKDIFWPKNHRPPRSSGIHAQLLTPSNDARLPKPPALAVQDNCTAQRCMTTNQQSVGWGHLPPIYACHHSICSNILDRWSVVMKYPWDFLFLTTLLRTRKSAKSLISNIKKQVKNQEFIDPGSFHIKT